MHEQGLSPEVLKEEIFIKLLIFKHKEVKDVVGASIFKDSLGFDAEDIVNTVKSKYLLLGLIILASALVESSLCKRRGKEEVIHLIHGLDSYLLIRH
jgi:hypothetical protein